MSAIQPEIAFLLMPVSPERPAGINIEYEQIYDDIRQARESDPDYLPQDGWTLSSPRCADWSQVRKLCETALTQKSKDLQLGCWFVEASTHLQGIEGARTGFCFLSEFITRFWFQCWPERGDDGCSIRYNKLTRLDRDISQALYTYPLLGRAESALLHWRKVLAFEHKISTRPDLRDELIDREGDLTIASFYHLAATFSSIEISQQADSLIQLQEQLNRLETSYFSLSQEEPHALFVQTRQTLNDMDDFLQRLAQRVIPVGDTMENLSLAGAESETAPQGDYGAISHQVLSRDIAISQMLAIAHYFRQVEPSSPVPFLMDRAARWANMTLTEWLDEMLTDSSSLREINNVLKGQQQS